MSRSNYNLVRRIHEQPRRLHHYQRKKLSKVASIPKTIAQRLQRGFEPTAEQEAQANAAIEQAKQQIRKLWEE